MSATSPCVPCCSTTTQTVNIPGIAGDDGVNGANGINAYTTITQNFTVPAIGGQVGVSLANSTWMVVGQNVIVSGPANFVVAAVPTSTSATLTFLGYPGDVVPGTVVGAGATVSPAGILGGGWTSLNCTADQLVTNSDTLTNSSYMQFTMAANTNYRVRGVVFFDTTASGDFKYILVGPAAPTLVRVGIVDAAAGAAPAERAVATALASTAHSLTGAGTTGGFVRVDAIIQNGATSDTFAFQFAQDTATPAESAVVRAGSYLEYSVVN